MKSLCNRRRIRRNNASILCGPGSPWWNQEDLIISKLFWAKETDSEIQIGDVRNLAATGCDAAYVENWTRELGLTNLWQQCRL